MDALSRLEKIGFKRIGKWVQGSDGLIFVPDGEMPGANVLYAFVSLRAVLYVGKTARPLAKRLYGYQRPHESQRTNVACNKEICKQLANNNQIDVFARQEERTAQIGTFTISEAAALEDAIIRDLQPPWNQTGRRNST